MALQVWLPLNGNLDNQGLCFSNFTTATATINNNGKIGKCYNFTQNTGNGIYLSSGISCADFMNNYINNHSWTLCAWIKTSSTSTTPLISLTYGLRFFVGASTSITLYNSSRTVSCSANIATNGGVWHHVAASYNVNTNIISIYVDGILKNTVNYTSGYTYASSWTNGIFIGRDPNGSTANDSYFYKGNINDVRIYDHCLSPKEVKKISKGLILHYKLDDICSENTTNIVHYPTQGSSVGSIGWDVSKHQNAIYVSNWGVGYNSGVSTPSQGYHACWKIIDGIPTMVMVDRNSTIGLTHRWLGISGGISGTMIPSNTTYTVSFEAMSDVQNKQMSSGVYYRKSSSGSYGFHDGCPTFTLSTSWTRYFYTYTISTVDNISSLYFYGHNGSLEGTVYIRNIQIELKNHATGYENGTRTATTIYDCSGYQYNGTITGNLSINNDTPRYNNCTEFSSSRITSNDINLDGNNVFSISCWIKLTASQSYQPIFWFGNGSSSQGFCLHGSSANRIEGGDGTNRFDNSSFTSISLNTWKHIVFTYNGTIIKEYVNGVYTQSLTYSNKFGSTLKRIYLGYFWGGNLKGNISDFRIYTTVLSDEDILELYNNPANIDNFGNMFSFEFDEEVVSKEQILKTGITKIYYYEEFDNYIKVLSDNSVFIKILHHNNPASNLFTSSNCWLFNDGNNLMSALIMLKNCNWINNLTTYEFLACEKLESSSTENQIRWKQTSNPAIATSPTGFTLISGTSSYLSPGLVADTGHGCFDMNGGSWWCCCGCYTGYSGGIPGFNGVVKSGYIDLYIRIPDEMIKGNFEDFVRFYKKSILSNQFIEK